MSCNSAIHVASQATQNVTTAAGTFAQVSFGNIVRRFGNALNLNGDGIICRGSGYFDVECAVTLTPTAAGPISVQLRQGNDSIQGATALVTGAAGTTVTIPVPPCMPRNCGCDCSSVVTLWVNAPCTITNVSTVVEKE